MEAQFLLCPHNNAGSIKERRALTRKCEANDEPKALNSPIIQSSRSFCPVSNLQITIMGGTTLATVIESCTQQTPDTLRMQPAGVPWHTTNAADDSMCLHTRLAKTLRKVEWCLDARVLGSLPLHALGLWVPSFLCTAHAGSRVPLGHEWQSGRSLFEVPARGPSRLLHHKAGSRVAALLHCPPLSGGRRPLTQSPRREAVSGPATQRVPTPRLLGVSEEWRCFSSRPCCIGS